MGEARGTCEHVEPHRGGLEDGRLARVGPRVGRPRVPAHPPFYPRVIFLCSLILDRSNKSC